MEREEIFAIHECLLNKEGHYSGDLHHLSDGTGQMVASIDLYHYDGVIIQLS